VPPASDTLSREGSKPKAETQHCGSVHESPVPFTAVRHSGDQGYERFQY
jgi:hypothetical protein